MLLVLPEGFLGDATRAHDDDDHDDNDDDDDDEDDLTGFPLKITGDYLSQPTNSDFDCQKELVKNV